MQRRMKTAMSSAALAILAGCATPPSPGTLRTWQTDPNPALQAMITRADRCEVVGERGLADGRIVRHVLRTIDRRSELDWLRESLRVRPHGGFTMRCETNGEPILVFYAGDAQIAEVAVIRAKIMRWADRYTSDFYLTSESSAAVIPVFAAWGCLGYDALMGNRDGVAAPWIEPGAATSGEGRPEGEEE